MQAAQRTMTRIGGELLANAKASALAGAIENGGIEKNGLHGRDILSLLVKANMATDNPESQRLSDKDVIARAYPTTPTPMCSLPYYVLQKSLRLLLRVMKLRGKILRVIVIRGLKGWLIAPRLPGHCMP